MKKPPSALCFCVVGGSFCARSAEKRDEGRRKLTRTQRGIQTLWRSKQRESKWYAVTHIHTFAHIVRIDTMQTHKPTPENLRYMTERTVLSIFSRDVRPHTGHLSHCGHPAGNNVPLLWSCCPFTLANKPCNPHLACVLTRWHSGQTFSHWMCWWFPAWDKVPWATRLKGGRLLEKLCYCSAALHGIATFTYLY